MGGYDLDATTASAMAMQEDYEQRSAAAAGLPGCCLDLAYGSDPRQKLDAFPSGPEAPVLIFLRGGYWKAGSKEGRRFPALEWCPRGVSWISVNYRLAPETLLGDIIGDARAAVLWVSRHADEIGIDCRQLHLVGNSAGGHLAAMAVAADWEGRPAIESFTGISGLYDLEPLLDAAANDWLNLSPDSAAVLSPITHLPEPELPVTLCCGGGETKAFKHQTELFAEACRGNGNRVDLFLNPGKDHFGIIGELGEPGTPLFKALERRVLAGGG